MAFHNFLKVVQKITHSGFDRDFREMQETETIDQVQSKDSLAEKKESSEGSGLLSSIDHNVTVLSITITNDHDNLLKVMKKSEKQEQNQGEVEDEGADRKYQVFRRNTFDRHLIEVMMLLVWLL